jgi:hypothetical protein
VYKECGKVGYTPVHPVYRSGVCARPFLHCAPPQSIRFGSLCFCLPLSQSLLRITSPFLQCGRTILPHVKCEQCMYDRVNAKAEGMRV